MGDLLSLLVTPANEQERARVSELLKQVRSATGNSVEIAFADQGYTGENAEPTAETQGVELRVVKLPEANKGFVLLPRRWVVERPTAWANRFRRLVNDYERLPETLSK